MITDSHCHLDYPNLFNQLDNIVSRAKSNNVESLLTICTTLESFDKIKLIIKKYKNIYGTFGIHPHESKKYEFINSKFIFKKIKENNKIIGVGETGLDYYYNHSDKKIQKKMFLEHIFAASELKIPIIVHTRNAEKDTFEIIKSELKNLNTKFLIHCFTGSKDFAKKLIDLNCYISFSGIITFKNAGELRDSVSAVPLENLLVETDSPYLAPTPFRGKPNEPSYIIHTIDKLSEIKNVPKSDVISYTTNNFRKLFRLIDK